MATRLAVRASHPFYDALFVATAIKDQTQMMTFDVNWQQFEISAVFGVRIRALICKSEGRT